MSCVPEVFRGANGSRPPGLARPRPVDTPPADHNLSEVGVLRGLFSPIHPGFPGVLPLQTPIIFDPVKGLLRLHPTDFHYFEQKSKLKFDNRSFSLTQFRHK